MLALAVVSGFMLMLDVTAVNVALPSLRDDLDGSFTDMQWVIDSYTLTLAVFLLTAGSLADRLGRKRVFLVGFLLFTLASLLCGLAWDMTSLNVARAFQGIGGAVLFAVGPILIGQEYHGLERGKALGIFAGGSGMGIALGPMIGGAITDSTSWRWIFLVNVPLGIAAVLLGNRYAREWRDTRARSIDWLGLVVFSAALAMLVFAILRGESDGWGSARIIGLFAGSVILLAVFARIEAVRKDRAMLDLSLFRVRSFNGLATVSLLLTAAAMGAIFLMLAYMQNELGHSAWDTGLRSMPLYVAMLITGGVAGVLTARTSPRHLMVCAGVGVSAGLLLMAPFLEGDSDWTALIIPMTVLGLGFGFYNPTRAAMAISVVEPRKTGMSNGMSETFQQVGMVLGIAVMGAVYEARVSEHFGQSAVAERLGESAHDLGELVAVGQAGTVFESLPGGTAAAASEAASAAVASGLGDVMAVGGIAAAVGTLAAIVLIRRRDMYESTPEDLALFEDQRATPAPDSSLAS
ncbi:MFS transporter [Streptomyces sedi]